MRQGLNLYLVGVNMLYVLMNLGRAHIADSKGDLKQIQESSVLFAKVGP